MTETQIGNQVEKSADAFRTISEVADFLDVPQHVLRFWETKFTQVKPMKRAGGRRYYRPDDVELLRRIRDLLYKDGFTIRGVQKLIRENGVRKVIDEGVGIQHPSRIANSDEVVASDGGAADTKSGTTRTDGALRASCLDHIHAELLSIRNSLTD